jgi:hypothetical protein
MMKRFICTALVAAGLGACDVTPSLPVEQAPERLRTSSVVSADRTLGLAGSVVRTYVQGPDGNDVEVAGVSCQISSGELSGRVTTPQMINYPLFIQADRFANRGQPSSLQVTCSYNGKSARQSVSPGLQSRARAATQNTAVAPNTVTSSFVPLTGAVSSSYPWVYPPQIRVNLR